MGFLSGLSTYITPATQALAGAQEGKVQGLLEKIKLDREAKSDAIKSALAGLQTRNIESEINAREHPKETPYFDQDGNPHAMRNGVMVPIPVENPSGASHVDNSTAESPTGPVADNPSSAPPVQQGAQQGGTPKPKTPKFGPRVNLTPRTFSVDGKPTEGFSDPSGKFYDTNHQPITGKVTPYVAPEHEDRTLVQTQGSDGTPIWTPRSEAAGMPAKVTTRLESATNTAATARLQAAVSEMNNAHKGMAEFEEGLKSGKYTINGAEQLGGRVANSFTHDDPISMGIQSTALAALNRTNPALARYIRRGLSFAEGESMISQRPSDFRTKMAAFLSTAASGASPEMIGDIQSRRTAILNPLNETVGASKAPGGTADNRRTGGPSGDINLGAPALPPLTQVQKVKAAKDPEYRDFLIHKGYKL